MVPDFEIDFTVSSFFQVLGRTSIFRNTISYHSIQKVIIFVQGSPLKILGSFLFLSQFICHFIHPFDIRILHEPSSREIWWKDRNYQCVIAEMVECQPLFVSFLHNEVSGKVNVELCPVIVEDWWNSGLKQTLKFRVVLREVSSIFLKRGATRISVSNGNIRCCSFLWHWNLKFSSNPN